MQINIYCVITNQMPHSPLMRAVVMLGHSLYFSCLPPPTTLNPNVCLLGTYETKMVVLTVSVRFQGSTLTFDITCHCGK